MGGPLGGVPMLLKDLLSPLAGAPFTSGSRFYKGVVPDYDAELVRRYERAGLNIVGKTSTPEFGIMPVSNPCSSVRREIPGISDVLRGARAAARLRRLRQASCRSPMVATAGARCGFRLRAVGSSRSNPRAEGIPPGPTRASTGSGSPSSTSSRAVCGTALSYSISPRAGADLAVPCAARRASVPPRARRAERKTAHRVHRSPAPPGHGAPRLSSRAHGRRPALRIARSRRSRKRGRTSTPSISAAHSSRSSAVRSRRASTLRKKNSVAGPRKRRARNRHVARRHARRRALGGRCDRRLQIAAVTTRGAFTASTRSTISLLTPTLGCPPLRIGELEPTGAEALAHRTIANFKLGAVFG